MKTLTLTSHYFQHTLTLRITDAAAARIENYIAKYDEPMDLINAAVEGYDNGTPRLFSESQSRRIRNFFAKDNREYFDNIEIR